MVATEDREPKGQDRRVAVRGAVPPRATFRDVFAVREFRALWFSEILSIAGDRLALVAITLLVFDRTNRRCSRPRSTRPGTCRG